MGSSVMTLLHIGAEFYGENIYFENQSAFGEVTGKRNSNTFLTHSRLFCATLYYY